MSRIPLIMRKNREPNEGQYCPRYLPCPIGNGALLGHVKSDCSGLTVENVLLKGVRHYADDFDSKPYHNGKTLKLFSLRLESDSLAGSDSSFTESLFLKEGGYKCQWVKADQIISDAQVIFSREFSSILASYRNHKGESESVKFVFRFNSFFRKLLGDLTLGEAKGAVRGSLKWRTSLSPDNEIFGNRNMHQYQFISTKPVDWKGNLLIRCEGDCSGRFSVSEQGVVWEGRVEEEANFVVYFDASPDSDLPQEETESTQAMEAVEKASWKIMRNRHLSEWQDFWDAFRFCVPDEKVRELYYANLYLVRSAMGRFGLSAGFTDGWGKIYFHDDFRALNVMAQLNSLDEFTPELDMLLDQLPIAEKEAKRFAKSMDKDSTQDCGASYEICLKWEPFYLNGTYPGNMNELVGSLWAGISVWRGYEYSRDKDFLERYYPILEGVAKFFSEVLLDEEDGRFTFYKNVEVDDWRRHKAGDDALAVRCLLEYAARAAEVLDRDCELRESLRYKSERIDLPIRDGKYVHYPEIDEELPLMGYFLWNVICVEGDGVEREVLEKSLREWIERNSTDFGQQFHVWWGGKRSTRSWDRASAIYSAALLNDAQIAEDMLSKIIDKERMYWSTLAEVIADAQFATPDRIQRMAESYPYFEPSEGVANIASVVECLTPSSQIVMSLNSMLVRCSGETLEIFPCVPSRWWEGEMSFQLCTRLGVTVSVEYAPSRAINVTLKDKGKGKIPLKIWLPETTEIESVRVVVDGEQFGAKVEKQNDQKFIRIAEARCGEQIVVCNALEGSQKCVPIESPAG